MKVRTFTAGIGVAALAVSGLALGAALPAAAEPNFAPNNTVPSNDALTTNGGDVVGVGSDTIEGVVQHLSDGWNGTSPSYKLATFDATGPVDGIDGKQYVTLRTGATRIIRPNGSGSGKKLLLAATNNPDVSFARSSSSLSTSNGESTELTQFPFAVDTLKMAVSAQTPTHAPATLTGKQILGIYTGTITNWSQLGGVSGPIHPYVPQTGSGTRSFFEGQLAALKGVSTWSQSDYPASLRESQEHDPAQIKLDADAIAPFSAARAASLSSGQISLESGWRARRAVYDVVRKGDAGSKWVADLFGPSGYFCTAPGRAIVIADHFEPLADQCGLALTSAPANLNTYNAAVTTTTVAATPLAAANSAHVDASVSSGSGTPVGVVEFFDGANQLGGDVPVDGTGHAIADLSGVAGGSKVITAKFLANNTSTFTDSSGSSTSIAVVKHSTTTATVAPGTFGHGGTATVSVSAEGTAATGNVTINVGGVSDTKALSGGSATFTVPGTFAVGSQSFSATYAGDTGIAASVDTKAYTVGQSAVVLTKTFPGTVKHGKRAVGTVRVVLSPASTALPNGTIVIKKGSKVVGHGTLVNGVVKIKLAKLARGKNRLVVTYSGSGDTLGASVKFLIVQK